jgi:hypothetical protein
VGYQQKLKTSNCKPLIAYSSEHPMLYLLRSSSSMLQQSNTAEMLPSTKKASNFSAVLSFQAAVQGLMIAMHAALHQPRS